MKFLYNICFFIFIQILLSNREISSMYNILNLVLLLLNFNKNFYTILIITVLSVDSFYDNSYITTIFILYQILPLVDNCIYLIALLYEIRHTAV